MDEKLFVPPRLPSPSLAEKIGTFLEDAKDHVLSFPFLPKRDYLTGGDNAFLFNESEYFINVIGSVQILHDKVDRETLVKWMDNYARAIGARYLKKCVRNEWFFGRPYWQDASTEFDVAHHLLFKRLPAPGGLSELKRLAADMMAIPLDFRYPLWHCTAVDGYMENGVEKTALIHRIHHSIGDGQGLNRGFLTYVTKLDTKTGFADLSKPTGDVGSLTRSAGRKKSVIDVGLEKAKDWTERAVDTATQLFELVLSICLWFVNMTLLVTYFSKPVKKGMIAKSEAKRKGFLTKQVSWSKELPLAEVMRVKNVLGLTVNDVMVSCVNGGVKRYLESRKPNRNLDSHYVWLIPTSLRSSKDYAMSNESSGYSLSIPTKESDPIKRAKDVNFRMSLLKRSIEPFGIFRGMKLILMFPWALPREEASKQVLRAYGGITNVPGPTSKVPFGTTYIERSLPLIMNAPNSMSCVIQSYFDSIYIAVETELDPDVTADNLEECFGPTMADEICAGFEAEFWDMAKKTEAVAQQQIDDIVKKVGVDAVRERTEALAASAKANGASKKKN